MYLQLAEDATLARRRRNRDKRNPAAMVALAPGRALFLAMLDLNIDGLATKLARQNPEELKTMWLKAGGDYNKLVKNINKGKGKKPKKIGFIHKFKSGGQLAEVQNPFLNSYNQSNFLSEDLSPEKKAKIIAASTAAGTAIGTAVPAVGNVAGAAAGTSLGGVIVALYPIIKKSAADTAGDEEVTPPPTADIPESTETTETDETENKILGLNKNVVIYGGIGLAGLGLIWYLTKKK